jgi:hypothetical protein
VKLSVLAPSFTNSVTEPLWASVSSSLKYGHHLALLPTVLTRVK